MMVMASERKMWETGVGGVGVAISVGWLGKALLAKKHKKVREQTPRISGRRACQKE